MKTFAQYLEGKNENIHTFGPHGPAVWASMREGKTHLGEPEQQTYAGWKKSAKAAGAARFEGDKDTCQAFGADGKGVAEWEGDKKVAPVANPESLN